MKAAILYSGGKDSNRALHWAMNNEFDVRYLVTMFPKNMDSMMYHTPTLNLVNLQSQAVGIDLIGRETSGIRDEEVEDLEDALRHLDAECLVSGALESTYQKGRVNKVCKSLGLKSYTPFWHHDLEAYLTETIDLSFDVRFVGVAALGFSESWLGRKLDYEALEDLKKLNCKYKVNLAGEGGEFETVVCDGPTFQQRIQILRSRRIWDSKTGSGHLVVDEAELVQKRGTR